MRRSKPDVADPGACERAALDLLARREHSRRELERKLGARGIDREQATEHFRAAAIDWAAIAISARDKRFGAGRPSDFKERARQARFLEYRGFDRGQIGRALGSGDDFD